MRFAMLYPPLVAAFGGWAAITLDDLPDYVVAQKPVTLAFTVRQHGVRPIGGLTPTVDATTRGRSAVASVAPGAEPGTYRATLTFPDTGDWTVTINSGFAASRTTLLPLKAIAAGAPAPAAPLAAERGRRLFIAKGCGMCHVYRGLSDNSLGIGPELTNLHLAPDFLARFLADPAAVLPQPRGTFAMPNLGLKPAEIAALVSFIGSAGPAAAE